MTNWNGDIYVCPICKDENCVPPSGRTTSPILIVGDAPGDDELRKGRPFCGATGEVFRIELAKVGLDIKSFRMCNMWYHKQIDNSPCLDFGISQVIKEANGRKAILLVGAATVKKFTGLKVSEVTGLEVPSSYFSAPLIMACVQPTVVFHGVIGDFRLSLQKFSRKVEKYL